MLHHRRLAFFFIAVAAGVSLYGTSNVQSTQPQIQAGAGLTQYTFGTPSSDETEILEIINRARANPPAEGQRLVAGFDPTDYGIGIGGSTALQQEYYSIIDELQASFSTYPARPPLAFNADLNAAAQFHLGEMLSTGQMSHNSPNGDTPAVRVLKFGYQIYGGENIAGSPNNLTHPENLPADAVEYGYETDTNNVEPGYGHRLNLLEPIGLGHVEVGIANQELGGWNVEDFGNDYTPALLAGVAFTDNAGTGFYVPGEGVGGVTVTAPESSSFYAVTVPSGAYTLPLDLLGPVYAWGEHYYYDPSTGEMVYSPLNPVPTVTVVFTDASGRTTTRTLTPSHTVFQGGTEEYEEDEFHDASGNVRYDNAEVDWVLPASATPTSTPTPTPTPAPTPVPAKPQVTIAPSGNGEGFTLTRTGNADTALLVSYAVEGTAVAGRDYMPLKGTKKIKAGKSSVNVNVQVLPGATGTLKLNVLGSADYAITAPSQAKIKLEPRG